MPPATTFADADGADDSLGTADDDLRLRSGSPAIDAGSNEALPEDVFDLDGDGDTTELLPVDVDYHVRTFDGGSGRAVVDMGAYEFGSVPVNADTETDASKPSQGTVELDVFPNPTDVSITLRVELPAASMLAVKTFDVLGRSVYETAPAFYPPGRRLIELTTTGLATGTYFICVTRGEEPAKCTSAIIF